MAEFKKVALYYEYFTFKENEDGQTVTLTDYDPSLSDSTDIVIPATVDLVDGEWQDGNTYTVTAITDGGYNLGVFYDSGITSVTFPSSLKAIGSYAFQNCSGLTGELNLGECTSLTSIGDSAFSSCSGLTGELNLGGCTSLTSIGSSAFRDCSKLTSISLPSSLTSIGWYAFYGCDALESVVFPEGSTGWYVTQKQTATSGTPVDVTNSSTNASNLIGQYYNYYWKRSV